MTEYNLDSAYLPDILKNYGVSKYLADEICEAPGFLTIKYNADWDSNDVTLIIDYNTTYSRYSSSSKDTLIALNDVIVSAIFQNGFCFRCGLSDALGRQECRDVLKTECIKCYE